MGTASRAAVIVAALLALAGVATVVLWLAAERDAPAPSPASASPALEDEVKRLRRENAELRDELSRRARPRVSSKERDPDGATADTPVPALPAGTVRVDGFAIAPGQRIVPAPDPLGSVSIPDLIERMRAAVRRQDTATVTAIEESLTRRGADAVEPLMTILRDTSAPAELRDAALRALSRLEAPGLAAVVENLYLGAKTDPAITPARRAQALSAAVAADPQAAVPVVQRLLWSDDAADRTAALASLTAARDAAFLPMLREQVMRPEAASAGAQLADAIAVIRGQRWSALQATGVPDTPVGGDIGAAWASKEADMGEVWLELDFESAVSAQSLRIRETYNPGAVARVEAVLAGGTRETLWEGRADVAAAPRWFEPALRSASAPVRTIRIVLDTNRVPGWNEIDAVELLGDGRRQWASEARASSSYSDR